MRTAIELGKDGSRKVFHRSGGMAWTHPEGKRGGYWSSGHREREWIVLACSCKCSAEAVSTPLTAPQTAPGAEGVPVSLPQSRDAHRRVFLAQDPKGPWTCQWCKCLIRTRKDLTVHHVNGDHSDNNPRNLAPTHHDCHWATHDAEERGAALARMGVETVDVESFVS